MSHQLANVYIKNIRYELYDKETYLKKLIKLYISETTFCFTWIQYFT